MTQSEEQAMTLNEDDKPVATIVRTYCEQFPANVPWPTESYCIIKIGDVIMVRQSLINPEIAQKLRDLCDGINPDAVYMFALGPVTLGYAAIRSILDSHNQRVIEITAAVGEHFLTPPVIRAFECYARGNGYAAILCRTEVDRLIPLLLRQGFTKVSTDIYRKELDRKEFA
jgi:hypothetical protein